MAGVPEFRQQVRHWIDQGLECEPGEMELSDKAMEANIQSGIYYYGLVQERRKDPQDDMISRLIAAEIPGPDGTNRMLDDIEITGFAALLGGAGAETVTKLMGSAVVEFARHPEQWQKLLDDRSKIPAAVEELLRYVGPVQYNVRYSVKEVELPNGTVPAHKPVFLMGASANRDPGLSTTRRPSTSTATVVRRRTSAWATAFTAAWGGAGTDGECHRPRVPARLHAALRGRLLTDCSAPTCRTWPVTTTSR